VIMVGQSVLGAAADHRALQTYRNAQAIFERVSEVQAHMDRHDRLLSRGISLLESRPHPWIEQHRVVRPPQVMDQVVTVNERIAAWITRRVGTMWAFYVAAAVQLLWMGLWAVGVQRFDPYPFAFLLFVSSLIQLVLMLVIMVGQEVLGRAADGRSEQTYLDAQAILYECQRLEARLTKQDRIIESLCDYTTSQVTERLARAIHDSYASAEGERQPSRTRRERWEELPDDLKEANRAQARHVGEKLAELGCIMVPTVDPSLTFAYRDEEEVLRLARLEHDRWMRERLAQGYVFGAVQEGRSHPDLVPWDELSPEAREKDVQAVRNIPAMLTAVGFQVLRVAEPGAESA
jgi:uncharacterized membrane protein